MVLTFKLVEADNPMLEDDMIECNEFNHVHIQVNKIGRTEYMVWEVMKDYNYKLHGSFFSLQKAKDKLQELVGV
tara:strand:+ start:5745 stop:5966 length:222 start_codon:yes stop_codon:yes gene_type:complete